MGDNDKTPVAALLELAVKRDFGVLDYKFLTEFGSQRSRFECSVTVALIKASGIGPSKQSSKHQAAYNALMKLQKAGIYVPAENPVTRFEVPLREEPRKMVENDKTPVTVLQELTVKKDFGIPYYKIMSEAGSQQSRFECSLAVAGIKASGSGSSKQISKHQAARNALMKLQEAGIYVPAGNSVTSCEVPWNDEPRKIGENDKTPLTVMQELAVKKGFGILDYKITSESHQSRFECSVTVAGIQASGSGPSKQTSKHQAAHNALMKLQETGVYEPAENQVASCEVPWDDEPREMDEIKKTPVAVLQELSVKRDFGIPDYKIISESGSHQSRFKCCVTVAVIKASGRGLTKQASKYLAARNALMKLQEMGIYASAENPVAT